jgi:hypothetical protein
MKVIEAKVATIIGLAKISAGKKETQKQELIIGTIRDERAKATIVRLSKPTP